VLSDQDFLAVCLKELQDAVHLWQTWQERFA